MGQMSHSGDFARWPHLGPIRPMARGGHLGPLSYVYGYRGGIGRRSSVEMTPATKLGHQSGDMSSLYGAAWPFLCPNRPFPRWADVGQRKNGRSVEENLSAKRRAWEILGGVQSGARLRSHIVGIHDHTAYPPALCAIFRATKTAKNAILGL